MKVWLEPGATSFTDFCLILRGHQMEAARDGKMAGMQAPHSEERAREKVRARQELGNGHCRLEGYRQENLHSFSPRRQFPLQTPEATI
jgi:hypothetical protein